MPDPEKLFRQKGALLKGHFKLASGLHSDTYFQSARLYEDPVFFNKICRILAGKLPKNTDTVAAVAMGGIIPAYQIAGIMKQRIIFFERVDNKLKLRRGFTVKKGEKFIIMEDVITTGGSAKELERELKKRGGIVKKVACITLRAKKHPFKQIKRLFRLKAREWKPGNCPLCKKNLPIDIPGLKALQT